MNGHMMEWPNVQQKEDSYREPRKLHSKICAWDVNHILLESSTVVRTQYCIREYITREQSTARERST